MLKSMTFLFDNFHEIFGLIEIDKLKISSPI